jgi:hypothetical protein
VKKLESQHDNIENILICRICMQNNHLKPIFNNNQFFLADMIRTCAEVEVKICTEIEIQIINFNRFPDIVKRWTSKQHLLAVREKILRCFRVEAANEKIR